ncbi:MAG: RNA polymerase subunit sigma-24 [Caulobacterales bacterium RIFOXYB1_FULL_67_16]|jgi:RNA polymerase sigma factor (sigma-70 family)|nr:MAG: RNA polymerase subunit sigma-24 [Caulobacterales bacterium RIFOXYB1_FULL_67_16]
MAGISRARAEWLGLRIFPHEPALRQWLSRRTLGEIEIDDVVQETYAILAALDSVDHIRNPRTYMFEVAKSVVLQTLRRSRIITLEVLSEATDGLQTPSDDPDPEQVAADRQELGRLAEMVAALPTRCREVFILRKIHGLSQREVAQRLDLSQSTVEKHIAKALGLLIEQVGRGGNRRVEASIDRDPDQIAPRRRPIGKRR